MALELHKQALEDAHDLEVTRIVSAVVAELRRRALLSKSYVPLAEAMVQNAKNNAAQRLLDEQ
jgi:hypothetical protein